MQQQCSSLQDQLVAAQQAASAAGAKAQQVQRQVDVFERRLMRAREGGNRAVEAAREKSLHLQAAGTAAAGDHLPACGKQLCKVAVSALQPEVIDCCWR